MLGRRTGATESALWKLSTIVANDECVKWDLNRVGLWRAT